MHPLMCNCRTNWLNSRKWHVIWNGKTLRPSRWGLLKTFTTRMEYKKNCFQCQNILKKSLLLVFLLQFVCLSVFLFICVDYYTYIFISFSFHFKRLAPDCSPTLASVLNVSSTSLHVTWTPLPRGKCRNGVLRGYKIYYNNTRTGKRLAMRIEENVTTTVNITGLSKYTEYSIRVLGYTVEDGPLSNEMTRRTSEDGK